MKKRLAIVTSLLSLPFLLGSGQLTVENSDLLYVRGEGNLSVTTGTLIYEHQSNGEWTRLFSRNQGTLKIELAAEEGAYHVESWSIPSDPMNPQRVHEVMTIAVGDGGIPEPDPIGGPHLLELLGAWGPCAGACPYDLNNDGVVNGFDMLILLSMWGQPWVN